MDWIRSYKRGLIRAIDSIKCRDLIFSFLPYCYRTLKMSGTGKFVAKGCPGFPVIAFYNICGPIKNRNKRTSH